MPLLGHGKKGRGFRALWRGLPESAYGKHIRWRYPSRAFSGVQLCHERLPVFRRGTSVVLEMA